MTDWRENLGWLIGSIATAVTLAIGWLFESGFLNTIAGIAVGAGIAFFIQTRTQKRAWKRDYSVKIVEEVYGGLFTDIKSIIQYLEEKYYLCLNFSTWGRVQEEYKYFMVDEKFRKKLDKFSERVEKYDRAVIQLENTILPRIANEETRKLFDVDTDEHAKLEVEWVEAHRRTPTSTSPDVIRCLKRQTHPKDDALNNKTEISDVECYVGILQRNGKTFHSQDVSKFNEFWKLCLERMKEDEVYRFMMKEHGNLLEDARNVRKELVKRIEETWKI